jgi:hypothetical protein
VKLGVSANEDLSMATKRLHGNAFRFSSVKSGRGQTSHARHAHLPGCREISRQLEERLDAELPKNSLKMVRNHLRRCANCTAYLDSLKKIVLLYRCCPDPRKPARMRQKLFAILRLRQSNG